MAQHQVESKKIDGTNRQMDHCTCHFCGSTFPTKDAFREHQLYCSDPGFCLCHLDRDGFLDS